MQISEIDCHLHYKHEPCEVKALQAAINPMMDAIRAVGSSQERTMMHRILECRYFRARNATYMVSMLLRAVKHVRANLGEYFPLMRAEILINAQHLEDAAKGYRAMFAQLKSETTPTH